MQTKLHRVHQGMPMLAKGGQAYANHDRRDIPFDVFGPKLSLDLAFRINKEDKLYGLCDVGLLDPNDKKSYNLAEATLNNIKFMDDKP